MHFALLVFAWFFAQCYKQLQTLDNPPVVYLTKLRKEYFVQPTGHLYISISNDVCGVGIINGLIGSSKSSGLSNIADIAVLDFSLFNKVFFCYFTRVRVLPQSITV